MPGFLGSTVIIDLWFICGVAIHTIVIACIVFPYINRIGASATFPCRLILDVHQALQLVGSGNYTIQELSVDSCGGTDRSLMKEVMCAR